MGLEQAALGLYNKSDKKNKVYYVNRKKFRFSVPKLDDKGKKVQKTNPANGLPAYNGRGEPEYLEDAIQFVQWHGRFTSLGYWSTFEVTKNTPKAIAEILEEQAKNPKSEIMSEEAFIKMTNPHMLETVKANEALEKELETLKAEKSKADEEIERLKKKAGIN